MFRLLISYLSCALVSAFLLPSSSTHIPRHDSVLSRRTLQSCSVHTSVASIAESAEPQAEPSLTDQAVSFEEEPEVVDQNTADNGAPYPTALVFFEEQLDICKKIVDDHEQNTTDRATPMINLDEKADIIRSRFKEHPRCTAKFGEALLHARDAGSYEEYQIAVQNAQSIVQYVESCRQNSNGRHPIRKGLLGDISTALTKPETRNFRKRQIEDARDAAKSDDFTLEQGDLEILGRLYYSAIKRNLDYLHEVGLTFDHGGFTALLALCRAVAEIPDHDLDPYLVKEQSTPAQIPARDGAKLDAALSNHFNGIIAPGCRFLFSLQHGLDKSKRQTIGRSKRLIVAFSSLGNGLVRHEFGGSLAKLNNQLCANNGNENMVFDVLFVADPSQSWYKKDSRGTFNGFQEYEQRIRAASKPYDKISLIGDSMGGSAALLFSHLATESVLAFSPQVNLEGDIHVSRHDMTSIIRDEFSSRLLKSVEEASTTGNVNVFVHRGVEEADVGHTDRLMSYLGPRRGSENVKIVEHPDCEHHQIAVHLKNKGQLAQVLSRSLIDEHR